MWKRVLPLSILLVLVIGGYGSLWLAEAPRYGWISYRIDWSSVELLKWATDRGITVPKGENLTNRIVEVDVKTGERARVVLTAQGYTQLGFVVSPDGRTLVVEGGREQSLRMIDIESGRVLSKVAHPWDPEAGRRSRWKQICSFSEDGRTLYAVWQDWEQQETKLIAWKWMDGSYTEVLTVDSEVYPTSQGRNMVMPPRFFIIPNQSPSRMIQFPNGYRLKHNTADLAIRRLDTPTRVVGKITTTLWPQTEPLFSTGGDRMYLQTWPEGGGLAVRGWDLRGGNPLPPFDELEQLGTSLPVFDAKQDRLYVPSMDRVELVGDERASEDYSVREKIGPPTGEVETRVAIRECIIVHDLKKRESLGELLFPPTLLMRFIAISPDGNTLAAVGFAKGKQPRGTPRVFELLLYDLSPFNEPTEPIGSEKKPNSPG